MGESACIRRRLTISIVASYSHVNYLNLKMPHNRRRKGRKTKFVTKRGFPFQLMKYAEQKFSTIAVFNAVLTRPSDSTNRKHLTNIRQGTNQGERVGNMIQTTGC